MNCRPTQAAFSKERREHAVRRWNGGLGDRIVGTIRGAFGGQQQRGASRGQCDRPVLIVADEPTGDLTSIGPRCWRFSNI